MMVQGFRSMRFIQAYTTSGFPGCNSTSMAPVLSDTKRVFFQDLAATITEAAQREGASPRAKFDHAWNLLDVVPAEFVEPQLPLRIALEANQSSSSVTGNQLDTLARAYFRAGQPAMAVEIQRRALSLLSEGVKDESMETALERYEQVLAAERQ